MAEPIVFYHNPNSRGRIVHWMLEEVGAPYRVELLRFEKGQHKRPPYLAINPMGKVPAIVHRETVVTETAAICAYLADAFPQQGLAPALDDPARGTYLRWLFFGAGCLEPAIAERMFSLPSVERRGELGYGSYDDVVNVLEKKIASAPYILGDRFSAADVYIGGQIGRGMRTKDLEPRDSFRAYLGRLTERPAYKRFSAKSEELAAELQRAS
jgi:glutathione S-transferase